MQRRALGILILGAVLLAAVLFGYFDMLNSETMRIAARDAVVAESDIGQNPTRDKSQAGGQAAAPIVEAGESAVEPPADPPAEEKRQTAALAAPAPRDLRDEASRDGLSPDQISASDEKPASLAAAPSVPSAVSPSSSAKAGDEPAPSAPSPSAASSELPVPPGDGSDAAADSRQSDETATASPGAPKKSATAPSETVTSEPRFDILRVEPDGSTVIAGHARPQSTITLNTGDGPVGVGEAGPSGDFAIALDDPLPPGDHAITITAQVKDEAEQTSRETAVVSVPQSGREDELMAMVTEPDAPSRIVVVPGARGPDHAPEAESAAAPSSDPATAIASPPVAVEEPAAQEEGGPAAMTTPRQLRKEPDTVSPVETARLSEPEDEAAGPMPRTVQPESITPPPTSAPRPATPEAAPPVTIEAVEVEPGKVYVAGTAAAGARVRVYVDDDFVAEDRAGADDRFYVKGSIALSVGEHMIRADQLDADGAVEARAEVAFLRPAEPSAAAMAALAPPRETGKAPPPVAERERERPTEETSGRSAESRTPPPESSMTVSSDETNEGRDDEMPAGAAANRDEPALPSSPQPAASATSAKPSPEATPSEKSMAAAKPVPVNPAQREVAAIPDAPVQVEPQIMLEPELPVAPPPARRSSGPTENREIAETDNDDAETARQGTGINESSAADDAAQAPDLMAERGNASDTLDTVGEPRPFRINRQAPLTAVAGRVIIRKGDNLWNISRDTYGEGRRFTVIYLANGPQIRDPDLIYPGQVFRLPTDSGRRLDAPAPSSGASRSVEDEAG